MWGLALQNILNLWVMQLLYQVQQSAKTSPKQIPQQNLSMKPYRMIPRKLPQLNETPKQHQSPDRGTSVIEPSMLDEGFIKRLTTSIVDTIQGMAFNEICDPRDAFISIPLPTLNESSEHSRKASLQKWTAIMCKKVLSASFQMFSTKQIDQKKTKIFCSQNTLLNILKLTQRFTLSASDFHLINDTIKSTLSYFLLKYPQSEGSEVNQKLLKLISQTNTLMSNNNNLLMQSGIRFSYRESGNYNDLIMQFINYILQLLDEQVEQGKTMFMEFEDKMQNIFESVSNRSWIEQWVHQQPDLQVMKNQWNNLVQKHQKQKEGLSKDQEAKLEAEEYQSKVKAYTKYAIGRKLSQNESRYEKSQIDSGNFMIKSSAVLRILTKWCDELGEKYQNDSIIMNQAEDIVLENGNSTNFSHSCKKLVLQYIEQEKKAVEDHLQEISINNNLTQSQNNYGKLVEDDVYHIEDSEKVLGKFANLTVRCLQSYLITYLNKLIHGLLKAAHTFHQKHVKMFTNWSAPPHLLTFTIGDLLRCKLSSQEKQVVRVYRQLQILSQIAPQKFKIVRVKNRLKSGTKDILINARFNDRIICQVQLAINSSINDFIYSSDKFNHYVYELNRALFGPISEMSSIWVANDPRIVQFVKLFDKQNPQQIRSTKSLQGAKHGCEDKELVTENLPFTCSICKRDSFENNKIMNNIKCLKCKDFWMCGTCRISLLSEDEIKDFMIKHAKHKLQELKIVVSSLDLIYDTEPIPQLGVYIPIMSQSIQPRVFKKVEVSETTYLFGLKNQSLQKLQQFPRKDQQSNMKKFIRNNLIFKTNKINNLAKIDSALITRQFLVPNYLSSCYKNRIEAINLDEQKIDENVINSVANLKGQKRIIFLSLRGNIIKDISQICQNFSNVRMITLNKNKIKSLTGIGSCKNLLRLRCMNNLVESVDEEISQCTKLTKVSLQGNKIKTVHKSIEKLQVLDELWLNDNLIEAIPDEITKIKTLKILSVHSNKIKEISENIGDLTSLINLQIHTNKLSLIPKSIVNLKNLMNLSFKFNKVTEFEQGIYELAKLKYLYAGFNKIPSISPLIGKLVNLTELFLNNNQIKEIPKQIGNLKSLVILSFQNNTQISHIPVQLFNNCIKLKKLYLTKLSLTCIPNQIQQLTALQQLHLDYNQIQALPEGVKFLNELGKLYINNNKLQQFPIQLVQLTKLTVLMMNDNQMHSLPNEIVNLKKLKQLHVENNKIKQIPDSLKELTDLQKLGIGNQTVQSISETVYELPVLNSLQISCANITVIPKKVFNMQNIHTLDIHGNKLTEIEPDISKMKKLSILRAEKNQISAISAKISDLISLTELNLMGNLLQELPPQFFNLKKLSLLNISNNKFTTFSKQFQKLTGLKNKFFRFRNNPLEKIECQDFLKLKGSKLSVQWLDKRFNQEGELINTQNEGHEEQQEIDEQDES